jgi:hypothetical protein
MEMDMFQQRRTAESNTSEDSTRQNRKRRLADEEEKKMTPVSQSKRAKGLVGRENVASGATRDRPHARSFRRSPRLRTGL